MRPHFLQCGHFQMCPHPSSSTTHISDRESDSDAYVFDRYNITSTDDVKDAIKTVTRYNKKKAGK